ncbi:MAG: hypothetical protein GY851_19130 [bacterium]|nr:hypothetical protein [bacterium]
MTYVSAKWVVLLALGLLVLAGRASFAETEDMGNGFRHHGVATPVSNHRGTVVTVDGDGRNVVLVWLFDNTGGYAILMIDAETGQSEQHPVPWDLTGDCPYASILSTGNKYYTHFNNHFCEFDPVKRAFTFCSETAPQMAMGMTEDDTGVIWSVTYPQSGVVSFDPKTREFNDFGHVYKQDWAQYQRPVAADDAGWVYFGIGYTLSQIISFDPATATATPIIAEDERIKGGGTVTRDNNGKVYGKNGDTWYELYKGEAKVIEEPTIDKKPIITSSQGLFHNKFADGKILKSCDLVNRVITVEDPKTDETKQASFDYTSKGAHIMGVATAPDDTIAGGTAFPMCFFNYNPRTDEWTNRATYCQCNTVVTQGDRFFVGGYTHGFILEWDPTAEWVPTVKGKEGCNPQFLTDCPSPINRPHDLLAHPDGKTLVLAGTPGYGFTGGGLLFWDRETSEGVLLEHTDILPQLSTMSLVALPEGKIMGGATTAPGTGGQKLADQAELYIMDMATKKLDWHEPVFPGVQHYNDLCVAPNGLVYGFADHKRFFVFDSAKRQVIHEQDTEATFGRTCNQQGPRVFVLSPDGVLYILFLKGIAQVDQETHAITMLAESPVPVGLGGDFLDGRIYFGHGSHMYSYEVPKK